MSKKDRIFIGFFLFAVLAIMTMGLASAQNTATATSPPHVACPMIQIQCVAGMVPVESKSDNGCPSFKCVPEGTCPSIAQPICKEGTAVVEYNTDTGCPAYKCVPTGCEVIAMPVCADGQTLVKDGIEKGCPIYRCVTPTTCPAMPVPASCPAGQVMTETVTSDGCKIVQCVSGPTHVCETIAVPVCASGQTIEKYTDDQRCTNYRCTSTTNQPILQFSLAVGEKYTLTEYSKIITLLSVNNRIPDPNDDGSLVCGKSTPDSAASVPLANQITKADAYRLAVGSDCSTIGTVTESAFCNQVTGTYWFKITPNAENDKKMCNPACVVNTETKAAEINWRCTGLLQPTPDTTATSATDTSTGVASSATSTTEPMPNGNSDTYSATVRIEQTNLPLMDSHGETLPTPAPITVEITKHGYDLGNGYGLYLDLAEGSKATFSVRQMPSGHTVVVPPEEYQYVCAPGCKEVADGCLCPKIRISKTSEGYTIQSTSTASGQSGASSVPVEAKQIRINPGDDRLTLTDSAGHSTEVGSADISAGIEIPVQWTNGPGTIKVSTDQQKLETYIKDKNTTVKTRETIVTDQNGLSIDTASGNKEIKYMPSEASAKAIEVLNMKFDTVELKQENQRPVYEFNAVKDAKILGFIPVKASYSATVDAQTGQVTDTSRPWYSFMAVVESK